MINLAVINLKTLLKRVVKWTCLILSVWMIIQLGICFYENIPKMDWQNLSQKNSIQMIKDNLIIAQNLEENAEEKNTLKNFLSSELAIFARTAEVPKKQEKQEEKDLTIGNEEEVSDKEEVQEIEVKPEESEDAPLQQNIQTVQTSVIEAHNKKDVYTDIYETVQIKNESEYSLTESMVTPNIKYSNCKDIIIYHTHTCESYTQTEDSQYAETGNFRTTDLNYSVARVGTELANYLAGKGYTVIHDTTFHDYPAYTGSYNRSLTTVTNLLNSYPSVDCVFDIHRDALRK